MARLLIVGGVAAGLSAASRARRLDSRIEITVLEKTPHIAYGACGLPYFLEGRVRSIEQLRVYDTATFVRERNIAIRTNTEVREIHHNRREAVTTAGDRIAYDRLILATGTRRAIHVPGAYRMDTWSDAESLKAHLDKHKPRQAAVIGAGYIGLEAVEMLRSRGLRVELFEASADVLNRRNPWLTAIVARHLDRCRVRLHLNTRVTDRPAMDLAILACGTRPNTALAEAAGIELGTTGAIRVSDRMETNLPDVWAAGDCAEALHLVTGRPVWFPMGTTANKMGRVAGASAAGDRERFAGIVGTSIVGVCGMAVAATGLSEEQARGEGFQPRSIAIGGLEKARYFRGHETQVQLTADGRTGRLLGAAIVGEDGVAGRINVVATALHQRMTVDEFAQLDLAYAPPYATVWDPLIIAARHLARRL